MRGKLKKIQEEQERLAREVQVKVIGYLLTALGFVAGLAMNDAIKSTIEYLFPLSGNSVVAKLIYAILLTMVIAAISVWLIRISERIEGKNKDEKAA
jgi:predicted cobalt transporter CbtA